MQLCWAIKLQLLKRELMLGEERVTFESGSDWAKMVFFDCSIMFAIKVLFYFLITLVSYYIVFCLGCVLPIFLICLLCLHTIKIMVICL